MAGTCRCGAHVAAAGAWCPRCTRAAAAVPELRAAHETLADLDRRRARAAAWAREVLADERAVYLDTETTGLLAADPSAPTPRVVDLAVLGAGGPLIDTLIHPDMPIPAESSAIHHIHDEHVRAAPRFADIAAALVVALEGRRCVIYNRAYDTEVIAGELIRAHGWPDCPRAGLAELWAEVGTRIECAMLAYADWWGEYHPRWRTLTWQPLTGGDHRALGDCRATLARLRLMAADRHPCDQTGDETDSGIAPVVPETGTTGAGRRIPIPAW